MQSRKEYERHAQSFKGKEPSDQNEEAVLNSISWPILLAVIPALGAFVAGSAEIWGDFMVILLMLYYVYKWITVPWSYYDSARSRRIIHQHVIPTRWDSARASVAHELRQHELVGLMWVLVSPMLAGYTLHCSRYFLSNHERYFSAFNMSVFILAASVKPLAHCIMLLQERTLYLQKSIRIDETQSEALQRKLDWLEEEVLGLREDFVTKKDIGQMAEGLSPAIVQLGKSIKRCVRKENDYQSRAEERFAKVDQQLREFDHFVCFQMGRNQQQCAQTPATVLTVIFLPLHITFWAAKRMTQLLPITRVLLRGRSSGKSSIGCKPLSAPGAATILTSARALVDPLHENDDAY